MKTYRCPACQTIKHVDQFAPDPTKKSGHRSHCRPCDATRVRAAYAAAHPGRRRRVPSYNLTRRRLREALGPASDQRCSCGAPAHHWAYDHADPAELVGDTGRGVIAAYSLDFSHYVPTCSSCHNRAIAGRGARRLRHEVAVLRVALWLAMCHAHGAPESAPNESTAARR